MDTWDDVEPDRVKRCMGCGEPIADEEQACAECVEDDEREQAERRQLEEMER